MKVSKIFESHKKVIVIVMNRLAYNKYRGWDLPEDEDGTDEGYLVEYLDGGKPNHKDHKGYISWSPKEQFDNGYTEVINEGLSFGQAIAFMKDGKKVARKGWNGKGMWLGLVNKSQCTVSEDVVYDDTCKPVVVDPWIGMKTAGDTFVPWLASQTDMLSNDWVLVE